MHVLIAGTRGIPASHGGFETFAQDLALYLVERKHAVTVYCQTARGERRGEDVWMGIRRILIPAPSGSWGTMWFDWRSVHHALREHGIVLTLGSNTGALSLLYRVVQKPNAMNMDGIEWKRDKYRLYERTWLRMNEWAGAKLSQHLIADHPHIATHLTRYGVGKTSIIPYGASEVHAAPVDAIKPFGLEPQQYYLVVARPEPENSILEIVRGHANSRSRRPLVVLGNYRIEANRYHSNVVAASAANAMFVGAVYNRQILQALRFHATAYIHGHRAGGTNPSLVEALGAGSAVVAQDNGFNRWVAGPGAAYFRDSAELASILERVDADPEAISKMRIASRIRHNERFRQEVVLPEYERLLSSLSGETREVIQGEVGDRIMDSVGLV